MGDWTEMPTITDPNFREADFTGFKSGHLPCPLVLSESWLWLIKSVHSSISIVYGRVADQPLAIVTECYCSADVGMSTKREEVMFLLRQ